MGLIGTFFLRLNLLEILHSVVSTRVLMEGRIIEQFALEMVGQRGRTVLLEVLCTFYH